MCVQSLNFSYLEMKIDVRLHGYMATETIVLIWR